jgi:aminoglycoside 6-adenylyltransferase
MFADQLPDLVEGSIIKWANAHEPVRLAMLTSTRAIPGGKADTLSDYDVILIVRDVHAFVENRAWLSDFGEVLIAYWDPISPDPTFGIDICANVVQYSSGLKLDFTLWPVNLFARIKGSPALPAELDAGYRILLDKDRLAEGLQPPTRQAYIPKKPDLALYQLLINDFLSDMPYVAKCLWRGELLPAKWCLDYDMKHVYLRPMLEWLVEINHAWSVPVGNLGKGLKLLLPDDIWADLECTYVGASIAENWEALFLTMDLFRRVALQVGDHLGYLYPEELHQRVRNYITQIRDMPSPNL